MAGQTLTITSGGFAHRQCRDQHRCGGDQGAVTTTGPELFSYVSGTATTAMNSAITGTGVRLVKSGGGTLSLNSTLNNYGGGTTVNQGTLRVTAGSSIPLATNFATGLVISNATVTTNAPGAIAAGNVATSQRRCRSQSLR